MSEPARSSWTIRFWRQAEPRIDEPLWVLWQSLMALYPLWRSLLTVFSPFSPFQRETSWFWFDVIRGLRAMPSSQAVIARLKTVTDGELDGVIALAEVNSKRQEHFFRSLVLAYVTVPFTLGAIWAQLAPGQLMGLLRSEDYGPYWGGTVAGLATALIIRFVADWRARSFLALLQMARIERQAERATPPEAAPPGARNR